jgi:hypothetical protein
MLITAMSLTTMRITCHVFFFEVTCRKSATIFRRLVHSPSTMWTVNYSPAVVG